MSTYLPTAACNVQMNRKTARSTAQSGKRPRPQVTDGQRGPSVV